MDRSTTTMLRQYRTSIKWISVGVIVLSLLALAQTLPLNQIVSAGRDWIDGLGFWGPFVYGLLYVVATVLFVPGSIPTMGGGAIFGIWVGVITVSISSTAGAMLAFLIARYAARDQVAEIARRNPKFDAIDRAVAEGGWKIVVLLRLSPAVPFNLQNYLYGLTQIRFWPCLLATWLSMLPGTFLYVYIGHVAGAAVAGGRERTVWEWVMLVVGLLATAAVTIYITVLAKRQLRKKTELDSGDSDESHEVEQPKTAASEDNVDESTAKQPWSALVTAAIALLFAATAVYAQIRPQAIEDLLVGAFGPPEVELTEAYERNPDATGPTFNHSTYDKLLKKHVREGGWVDYAGLRQDERLLERYVEAIGDAPFDELGRNEKLALLINAYNAFTLKLILEHYPVASIRDIPASRRWSDTRWQVGSHRWSLNEIEHEQIRPKFREPRIHFALVCAAIGCPPLRTEAYTGDRIDEQLADQTEYVHGHDRWLRFEPDENRLHLTKLYKWYGGDFEQIAGSVLKFVATSVPTVKEHLSSDDEISIRWLTYDWSLNSVENMP